MKLAAGDLTWVRPETNTTLIMPILRPNTTALDEWGKARAKTHIVVVCTSAVDAFERRASVRKTWIPGLSRLCFEMTGQHVFACMF